MAELCVSEINSTDVLAAFYERLDHDWKRPNTFQLAQAPLAFADYTAFRSTVMLHVTNAMTT